MNSILNQINASLWKKINGGWANLLEERERMVKIYASGEKVNFPIHTNQTCWMCSAWFWSLKERIISCPNCGYARKEKNRSKVILRQEDKDVEKR